MVSHEYLSLDKGLAWHSLFLATNTFFYLDNIPESYVVMYILLTVVHHDEGTHITDSCTVKR